MFTPSFAYNKQKQEQLQISTREQIIMIYSQPSMFMGSTSVDSKTENQKYQGKKNKKNYRDK